MCGRYTAFDIPAIQGHFGLALPPAGPDFNAAPGQEHLVVTRPGQGAYMRWGLVPRWARDEKIAYSLINARAETLPEKPSFRQLLVANRCLIPANGFYEWRKEGKSKRPFHITLEGGRVFAFAGLYDIWQRPDGTLLHTYTIITTPPSEPMAQFHDRQPLILHSADEDRWMSSLTTQAELEAILHAPPRADLSMKEANASVGNVRNQGPELLEV